MLSKLFRNKKGAFTESLGEELVDEVIEAGLAILLVIAGVSYFNMESRWSEAVSLFSERVGLTGVHSEISMMYNSVADGFPFNFIANNFAWTVAIGVILCVIGLTIKIITIKSKEEFIKDMGKVILIPGVIGVIAIIFIQIMTVSSLNDLLVRSNLVTTELALSKIEPGMMLWNMMGLLFLMGFFSLILGAMLVFVVKSLKEKPAFLTIFGNFLVFIGWFGLGYYLVVRLLALDVIAESLYGSNILKLFAFAWYMSRGTFIIALCMFALGFSLYKYGSRQIRRKRRMAIRHAKREQMILHKSPYEHHTTHNPQSHGHQGHKRHY